MCQFFSFVTDERGNKYYFNDEQRKNVCILRNYDPDSHTSIADHYGFKGIREDLLNKWEYNHLTGKLVADTTNFLEDREAVLIWCKSLDFNCIDSGMIKLQESIGKKYRVKSSVYSPRYGWGSINHNDIGTLIQVESSDIGYLNFEKQGCWKAKMSEMEEVVYVVDCGE